MDNVDSISGLGAHFLSCPEEWRREQLELIEKVRKLHLHVEDQEVWKKVRFWITQGLAHEYRRQQLKQQRQQNTRGPIALPQPGGLLQGQQIAQVAKREFVSQCPVSMPAYCEFMVGLRSQLQQTFRDPEFTAEVMEAAQNHLMAPLAHNVELLARIVDWVVLNATYLPLGEHLLDAYMKDMRQESAFAKSVMVWKKQPILEEASAEGAARCMRGFLAAVDQANRRSQQLAESAQAERPVAVLLDLKCGAGGHTAPAKAMQARLEERGWKVVEIRYDVDLDEESDILSSLGVTFADGSPMTDSLFITRWTMPKHNVDVAKIVRMYAEAMHNMYGELFEQREGAVLLRRQILQLRPKLIVTTLAYHWIWGSLAYRVPSAKTLLVASDVFFHREAALVWQRQRDIDPKLRQVHFGVMTGDLKILKSIVSAHDRYFARKNPQHQLHSLAPVYNGFTVDEQISVIGSPINPAFKVVTGNDELALLRKKWALPEGALSICLSRGRMAYTADLIDGLEGYRGDKPLERQVFIQVVCGENEAYLRQLENEGFDGLAPGITIVARPLLTPTDFAQLRAISLIDDIKAGGGTTMEGWHLVSEGSATLLLMTPGPKLFWEECNCLAMKKWGVGRYVEAGQNKLSILRDVIKNGLPDLTNPMPKWKPAFDEAVTKLCGKDGV